MFGAGRHALPKPVHAEPGTAPPPSLYSSPERCGVSIVDFSAGIEKDRWSLEVTLLNAFDTRAQLYRYSECTISVCGAGTTYVVPNKPRTISVRLGAKF